MLSSFLKLNDYLILFSLKQLFYITAQLCNLLWLWHFVLPAAHHLLHFFLLEFNASSKSQWGQVSAIKCIIVTLLFVYRGWRDSDMLLQLSRRLFDAIPQKSTKFSLTPTAVVWNRDHKYSPSFSRSVACWQWLTLLPSVLYVQSNPCTQREWK